MIIQHNSKSPTIDDSAYIAPNAVICGDVSIGKNVRIMFGAQIIAENSSITIGDHCIILENAVIRGTSGHPVSIGENCLVGPHAHLAGCAIEAEVFIATGASVFHGATVKKGAEVRVNGIVHLRTVVPEKVTVPINWIAVGEPMELFPPGRHKEIWNIQKNLNFPKQVYGLDRSDERLMQEVCRVMGSRLSSHLDDKVV